MLHASVRREMMIEVARTDDTRDRNRRTEVKASAMKSNGPNGSSSRWRIVWKAGVAEHSDGGDGEVQYWTGHDDGWTVRFYIQQSKWLSAMGVKGVARGLYAAREYKKGEVLTYYGGEDIGPRYECNGSKQRRAGAGMRE